MNQFRLYIDQFRYASLNTRRFAQQHYSFYTDFESRIGSYYDTLDGKRILDIGCGRLYWFSLLLHSRGALVTGIDKELVEPVKIGPSKYLRLIRKNSIFSALKTCLWDTLYAKKYYSEMQRLIPFAIHSHNIDLRQMDAMQMTFPDNTFDLIVSHEVFEHLPNVPAALSEMHRVMKPEAIAYVYIHNYTSLSGGHNIRWKYPDTNPPSDVPPWDHLRENLYPHIPSYINRLRLTEFYTIFEREYDLLEWNPTTIEGERFLTGSIRKELSMYSEDELLTKGVILIARPKY